MSFWLRILSGVSNDVTKGVITDIFEVLIRHNQFAKLRNFGSPRCKKSKLFNIFTKKNLQA